MKIKLTTDKIIIAVIALLLPAIVVVIVIMRQIILDLLEFSRIGRAKDKLEIVDLNQMIDEILRLNIKRV